jgi:tetratricopeptide (TPR) repeat protein
MEAYERAIESGDPALASAAWYNLGNALYRRQQLEQSLEAYKQALRVNPNDADAKYNLERVLEQMQEQEQQQEQQSDQSQDQQNEQDQSQQDQSQEDESQQDQSQESPSQEQDEGQDAQREQPPDAADGDQEASEAQGEPQPQPGQMTPEEAERLLDAIREDPGDVNRKPASARGRRPRKPW